MVDEGGVERDDGMGFKEKRRVKGIMTSEYAVTFSLIENIPLFSRSFLCEVNEMKGLTLPKPVRSGSSSHAIRCTVT